MKLSHAVVLLSVSLPASAFAGQVALDPGVTLQKVSSNTNDAYIAGRGMMFTMNTAMNISSFGFYTNTNAMNVSFTLRRITSLVGQVNDTSTLLNTTNGSISGAAGYHDLPITGGTITLHAGWSYHLEIKYSGSPLENYYYNWNGTPAATVGAFHLIDGTQSGGTYNTVAPALRVNAVPVPEPATFAALGFGAIALLKRRKR